MQPLACACKVTAHLTLSLELDSTISDVGLVDKRLVRATAKILRLVTPYFGSARVVIADSWFGSYKCAVALRQKALFSIMNVKTGHKKFQKHYKV